MADFAIVTIVNDDYIVTYQTGTESGTTTLYSDPVAMITRTPDSIAVALGGPESFNATISELSHSLTSTAPETTVTVQ